MTHQSSDVSSKSARWATRRMSSLRKSGRRALMFPLALLLTGALLNQAHQLLDAIASNNIQEVKRLVESGVDVNSVDEFGFSVLVNALAEQNLPVVDLLIENGGEVFHNAKRCQSRVSEGAQTLDSQLLAAITEQDVDQVRLLLKQGARVNACDDFGFSMLVNALAVTDNEMINFLVSNGATMKTSI